MNFVKLTCKLVGKDAQAFNTGLPFSYLMLYYSRILKHFYVFFDGDEIAWADTLEELNENFVQQV